MKKILALVIALAMIFALCGCGGSQNNKESKGFVVKCVDEKGAPVVGAKIQLCTDKSCFMSESDENGNAVFDVSAGSYDIHVYKTAQGYDMPEVSEIVTGSTDTSCQFVFPFALEKAEPVEAASVGQNDYTPLDDIDFSKYKLVIVNYWEPWCYPCKMELPHFEKIYQQYKDKGVLVVGMYRDTDNLQEVLDESGITYPIIQYSSSEFTQYYVPVTVFYDSSRNILPATVDETISNYVVYLYESIDSYDAGELDKYTDPDTMALKEKIPEIRDSNDAIEAYAAELAQYEIDLVYGGFSGYSDYDSWVARVNSRLG